MNKFKLFGVIAIIISYTCASLAQEKITNYTAEGSLDSSKPSGCIAVTDLNNTKNPVDIFIGVTSCLEQENYINASKLYLIGMIYGYFDTKRVSDKTAHQAVIVIRMNAFESQKEVTLNKLQNEIKNILSDNKNLCNDLNTLGAPTYKPIYMIQHGIGAFTGQSTKNGLIDDFDVDSTWKESITKIAKCTQS